MTHLLRNLKKLKVLSSRRLGAVVFLLGFGFLGAVAQAQIEVTCKRQDCMTYGWVLYDLKGYILGETNCYGGDCSRYGWSENIVGRGFQEVLCYDESCFLTGWVQQDAYGRWLNQVTCNKGAPQGQEIDYPNMSDCLTFGWRARNDRGDWSATQCLDKNCENVGWVTNYSNGYREMTSCKDYGCFQSGWIVRPY